MKVEHFKSAAAFRQWLEKSHAAVGELWVGFYKKDSGLGGLTYAEAVDEALCFGWIDGLKKRVKQVRPILVQHCYSCHSHAGGKMRGGLALDSRSGWEIGRAHV